MTLHPKERYWTEHTKRKVRKLSVPLFLNQGLHPYFAYGLFAHPVSCPSRFIAAKKPNEAMLP